MPLVDYFHKLLGRVYPAEYGAAVGSAFLHSRGAVIVGDSASRMLDVKAFEDMLEDASDLCEDAQLRQAPVIEV